MIGDTTYKLPVGFKTSIKVLNKVLYMPCSTIEHELKKHNYSFHNQSSNCIDEKMLDIFADKFCKNLKRYFERSLQNFETLSIEEKTQFHEFAQTYSKYGRFTRKWRDIDKDAIKVDFFRQIVELTNCKKNIRLEIPDSLKEDYIQLVEYIICVREQEVHQTNQDELSIIDFRIKSAICRCDNESLRVFDAADLSFLNTFSQQYKYDLSCYLDANNETESQSDSVSEFKYTKQDDFHNRVILVEKIKRSRLYLSRCPSHNLHTNKFVPLFVRFYVCARFHIVSDDGTEDEMNYAHSLRA